jgi:SAM-dependent methyltransferase
MTGAARHDAWSSGAAYERYMGRWSRRIAPLFLDWLAPAPGLDWLEIGCGSGALTAAILARGAPRELLAIEPSEGFLAQARATLSDPRVAFRQGGAPTDLEPAGRDLVVSGLVLNFIPDRAAALADMRRLLRPGGRLGFYVWDYPGGGVEFLRAFWTEAVALDPAAEALTEGRRFPFCAPGPLAAEIAAAGFREVEIVSLKAESRFAGFDDYWRPFTLGAGPAPGYCASLPAEARDRLEARLRARLVPQGDGPIALRLRAWAARARA